MSFRTNILDAEIWQRGIVAYGLQVPLTTLKALQGRLQRYNLLNKFSRGYWWNRCVILDESPENEIQIFDNYYTG